MRKHAGKAGITGLLIAILVAVAAYLDINLESLGIDVGQTPTPSVTEPAKQVDWYQIYFTDPTCPPEDERSGGIDDLIVADLMTAKERIDVAAYDLDVENIVNALIDLEERELPVRVVTDTDNGKISAINRLRRHGISVVEDKRSTIMHNKFIIIDDRILWMGSMNLTVNGIYCNNNNFVRFESPELTANYAAEMDEMYDERIFGPTSPDNALSKTQSIYDIHVENYFAAEDEIAPVVANVVSIARDEILFMAFSFTHGDIGDAMIDR
ncbi:MAG: hypothetical protein JRJ19_09125, partial [Deltaproteobacteria bacterium]|nr:hypothetical protein [Deltaproteobacteria bacterium]